MITHTRLNPSVILVLAAIVLMLQGCATGTAVNQPRQQERTTPVQDYSNSSVQELIVAAERANPGTRQTLLMQAAESAYENGDIIQSERILALITAPASPEISLRTNLLEAELALKKGQPDTALSLTEQLRSGNLSSSQLIRWHKTRAAALESMRSYAAAARELILLNSSLSSTQRHANHERIFSLLTEIGRAHV